MNEVTRPEGIEPRHIHEAHGSGIMTWGGVVLLGVLLIVALCGVFGKTTTLADAGEGVKLTIEGPKRIRSGEYFEMMFTIETEREIKDAVLSVDADVWHDFTVNTMIPAATEEGFENGSFDFHYGALPPGTRLLVKVDGQVNPRYPPGPNQGAIEVTDGPATLASIDYTIMVFP
ncbi:MAG TPA: hypothetical protein VFG91_11935 [Woeseiaceae bacterium]|nr:hypothetical protein [Woeseiaceae bacterium]